MYLPLSISFLYGWMRLFGSERWLKALGLPKTRKSMASALCSSDTETYASDDELTFGISSCKCLCADSYTVVPFDTDDTVDGAAESVESDSPCLHLPSVEINEPRPPHSFHLT